MLTLALLGLVSGLITGVSPCVLPMIPIVFVTGGAGDTTATAARAQWVRPLLIIVGIVLSFGTIALLGTLVLSALHLPTGLLRWTGIALLALVGLSLMIPQVAHVLERPFARFPSWTPGETGGTFGTLLLGIGLGTLYVPCAGPVLAAISIAGATAEIGWRTVVLTISFALGAAIPLAFFALAGASMAKRLAAYRQRQRAFRIGGGAVLVAMAVAIAVGAPATLQRVIPGYTGGAERAIARQQAIIDAARPVSGTGEIRSCIGDATRLAHCGAAPEFSGAGRWFNTDGRPLTIAGLRGKVVLVDFWTYSCINCLRDAPYVKKWDAAYRAAGLVVVGVHTPEFAFEHDPGNVAAAIKKEGIAYPVVQDNDFTVWNAYMNRYWPAKYLIDASGAVRARKFGEGDYATTENALRALLRAANPAVDLPAPVTGGADVPSTGPTSPEMYLGARRGYSTYAGAGSLAPGRGRDFTPARVQPIDTFSLGGRFDVDDESVTSVSDARVRVSTRGAKVFTVLSGRGALTVRVTGEQDRTIAVDGLPRLYTLVDGESHPRVLDLSYTPGISVYTFTFG
ncbi:MAG TPA: cytochrome c biogenesis protein DipZ [Gordonia sp. (in: high G+C Gram-positive bacteria)]|uniref:cytochrome c biogenesis protein DipZ n=1 Tax=unclassified Gordonia (in: high G+C Gram-positive bacteria) TaxID=2657482 RepID=UPI000FA64A4E|nr:MULTISPECIES: cytochrome c biogenesis protein DipZ [unclassified Gordonia (in: high G+C Gram-positive bacteria)]RUP37064.1 MAG: cytochrome c biogenesis protein DipZ [Gordonia sp. (in: high G+C Gram-positive bacteria)]HNP55428.1 cytochrome c biogenesis protein DipZ [Gordonia sp. (in: high G+C Gram-positive bacteria)]HRC51618.1 cytochrome c biogenesis protein DipZ [Gordonia sp. (in: high G+C Gram-positive bacteria)]